ncbi:DASH complex subunit spc19 [Pestalotiopsis sp. IQ-011]
MSASAYGDCVAALRGSLSHLESSAETLGNGVADFPRLISVLKTVRSRIADEVSAAQHYELIPQPTLVAAEASLRDEIGPAITTLLDRADSHIDRVERRIESLKARADLQQGRLTERPGSRNPSYGRDKSAGAVQKLGGEAKLRAKAVKQRREALEYSIERLELEVSQKERELRKQIEKA